MLLASVPARAQILECTGHDPEGATAAFDEGYRLLERAAAEATQHHADEAQALAQQALVQFDLQCESGDTHALAERGAALLLLHQRLPAAQTYDAFLAIHPIESLDARARRRIEANLERSILRVRWTGPAARLIIDGLDFGALPRDRDLRVPDEAHAVEARVASDGHVLASATATAHPDAPVTLELAAPTETPVSAQAIPVRIDALAPTRETAPEAHHIVQDRAPEARTASSSEPAWMTLGIGSAVGTGVFLAVAIALHVVAENRAQTYRTAPCNGAATPASPSCGSVLDEYNSTFPAAIAFDVLGGAAAIATAVFFGLDLSRPHDGSPTLACSFAGSGVGCLGRF